MKYQLKNCSWDLTQKCNLQCRHCSEAEQEKHKDLTRDEALDLVSQIIEAGTERVIFTGGEPFLREDWEELASALTRANVEVTAITNGTLLDEDTVRRIKQAGIGSIGISIDGIEETHDLIRGEGCFRLAMQAFGYLKKYGIYCSAITTVMKENLRELPEIKAELTANCVDAWQIQPGIPIGRLKQNAGSMIEPEDMEKLLDFCCEAADGSILIYPADSIGYYSRKETALRGFLVPDGKTPVWKGCKAGISSMTIRNDGNVVGASMCIPNKCEGNIKERRLKEIWEDEDVFAWNRKFDCSRLKGFCGECRYKELCRGGCMAMRLWTGGSITSENKYCLYRNAVMRKRMERC